MTKPTTTTTTRAPAMLVHDHEGHRGRSRRTAHRDNDRCTIGTIARARHAASSAAHLHRQSRSGVDCVALSGEVPPRPLTHDLMAALVTSLEVHIDSVEVTDVVDGAFTAELTLSGPAG